DAPERGHCVCPPNAGACWSAPLMEARVIADAGAAAGGVKSERGAILGNAAGQGRCTTMTRCAGTTAPRGSAETVILYPVRRV
ncbi:MAG TPA: hypothetical protein VIL15_01155, partial [Coriobacteriia bacterium]